ncbi:aldolase 1 epimerase LacX [Enterococcus haemoperoxidus ATCC BAA-382]|uniref:Aldolase 1 epimerase LacX n=1 Tax=Enterococcus haemoperoxidus ATCC BAA-382 TaxID=1158608 RepID=R2STJ4_9ENTE|nr:aldose 1-epimerase family protein [Enterococcus haemoperoxidus]EOH98555.1 aldolase 1 epimerase LacX [Enterococcus haemoperoxidus ATCC BAA-382]EOT62262.1 aldolase 1 epimerase LacX [Enterococcus haemoperoxidus ATCC BAA-382]OJG55656.1 aldolase 1 epimerase LacX [Enterococcus haemoperoxidus]
MTVQIENEYLIATIAEDGAELVSLKSKKNNIEYIWQGDPAFWGRHAPVLFPVVGRLKEDQYTYEEHTYPMSQHGFARDSLFEVIEHGSELVSLSLKSSKDSKKVYPFDFELILSYALEADNLVVNYQVENTGNSEMYFSIGGHPAFNVPLEQELSFNDYYLSFSPKKSRTQIPLAGPFADFEHKTLGQTNTSLDIRRELFKQDAIIFETKGVNAFTIETDEGPHSISLSYSDMPYVGIWSPYPQEAPFVCIEPWCGIADDVNATGNLVDKKGINKLGPSDVFKTNYTITAK